MTTNYPAVIDSYTRPATGDPVDSGATKQSTVADNLYDAVEAIEGELGINPSGVSATVVSRLDTLDTTVAAKLAKASNLSDLTSTTTARTNLGLGSAAVLASTAVAQTANNLSDLASASTARTNLGLGTSAVLDVPSSGNATSGQVVKGSDTRLAADVLSTVATSGSSQTISAANGVVDITLTANCTLATSGTAAGAAYTVTLILRQDGTGSRTVTWPTTTKWAGGTPPTLSTAASAVDVVTLTTVDNGTTWYGFLGGKAFA